MTLSKPPPAVRPDPTEPAPAFRRVLGLSALLFFGIAFVGPTAPYTFFGLGSEKSQGHLALVYVIATIAMTFTAISYGRMANAHPRAGSAYAYASAEVHPLAGYFAGWAMILDYVFLPIISVIIVGATLHKLVPAVPYVAWVVGSATATTLLNLRGIIVTTRFTLVYTVLLGISVVWFVTCAINAILHGAGEGTLLSLKPFYHAPTFSVGAIQSAFAITVLSFLGFDGTSTLAEDAHNPRRDVPRATVLTCLVCGATFISLTYLGQLLHPDWTTFHSQETAFSEIGRLAAGGALFVTISAFVLGQAATSAVTSQASASRLLFGMAREGRLAQVFGRIHPRLDTPIFSVVLIGIASAVFPLVLTLDQAAEMVNFGACLGFMGVNLSALLRSYREWRKGEAGLRRLIAPLGGLIICSGIWLSLAPLAMTLGAVWCVLGVAQLAVMTRGKFKLAPA